jgi:hypothetical protein
VFNQKSASGSTGTTSNDYLHTTALIVLAGIKF